MLNSFIGVLGYQIGVKYIEEESHIKEIVFDIGVSDTFTPVLSSSWYM